jgi:uncharacterized membrane protein
MRLLGYPTFGGLLLALVFWWQALTPTLIPRSAITQAAVSGLCAAIGYGIGTLVGRWIGRLLADRGRGPGPRARQVGRIILGAGWLIAVTVGSALWVGWQNDQRDFMGMASVGWTDAVLMVVLSLLAGALFVVVGRALARGVAAINRFNHRHLPAVLAAPATIVLLVVLVVVLGGGVAWRGITAAVNALYGPVNAGTNEGTVMPESPSVSGSSQSLVAWETLGLQGREFVAGATTAADLKAFHGPDAEVVDPVRVYVGVASADSPDERAELAVQELQRAGGFDREVLAVWVPTGTGWMIAEATAALEQLHQGDTAIAAIQYSYLPSLFAVFMDNGAAEEAGIALFNAVHEYWSTLPADERPELVLFGKSLGTAGVEAPFAGPDAHSSVANLVARTDGALVVGAKEVNPILRQLTRERDPASPVWQPIFDDGRSVRFVNRDPDQPPMEADWPAPRIVYLQHPSDPVPYWSVEALWWPPEWLDHPRGFDVPDSAGWFPIASGVQAVADLIFQLSTPPGFGHVYSTDYADGWARVVPPDGWTDADTERLEDFIAEGVDGGGESEP